MKPTLLVMAGGTGGHVMPGLAVAEVLRRRQWHVIWLGHPDGMEAGLVPRHQIPMRWLRFGGLRGKGWWVKALLPWQLARACLQALKVLRAERPTVVLGMGGYVAFPGGLMAALLRIPLVIHEQNAVAGLTNAVLARLATRALEAFPGALAAADCTGNPVRADVAALVPPHERYGARTGPLRILIVGGSLGARILNTVVPKALALLAPERRPYVLHQSGRGHLQMLQQAYLEVGVVAETVEFIDDMAAAYQAADLVICRAGAMTVSELAAAGVASLLVPYPHAVDDHQTRNAAYLAERGAARLMPQAGFSPEYLAQQLAELDRSRLQEMAIQARERARPDAAERVADICEALAVRRGGA